MRWPVYLEPQPEGGFTVTCPALPGCISEGDTKEEALANIREAIGLVLEVMVDRAPVPPVPALPDEVEV
ncbi:MAG TPA: type II toxin-antitoxin system HicB family antitoxin [Candidatus Thermoplasmatota archaeon]|nr:type II toxin-antitoxin system HicB family antitoxin [Candidatus Thermoplasmatota archaeon]